MEQENKPDLDNVKLTVPDSIVSYIALLNRPEHKVITSENKIRVKFDTIDNIQPELQFIFQNGNWMVRDVEYTFNGDEWVPENIAKYKITEDMTCEDLQEHLAFP